MKDSKERNDGIWKVKEKSRETCWSVAVDRLDLVCLTAEMSDRKQPNVTARLPASNLSLYLSFPLSLTHTHTHVHTSISYLHWSHPKTALLREAYMFLNPPADGKSIVFRSPTSKKIVNTVSSVHITQLKCSMVLIQISPPMADKNRGVCGTVCSSTKLGFVSGSYTEKSPAFFWY